jgi:hypothetical protein
MIRPLLACLAYKRAARRAMLVCVSVLLAWPAAAAALDDGSPREFFGLLRVRDLTPFGFRASTCGRHRRHSNPSIKRASNSISVIRTRGS